jgi:hypothetical protein
VRLAAITRSLTAGVLSFALAELSANAQVASLDIPSIQKLEASIKPSDYPKWWYIGSPRNLADYARYYAEYVEKGHRVIAGEFVQHVGLPDEKAPGIYIVRSRKLFPMIDDGACSVVNVLYNADSGKLLSLKCNGRA